MIVSQVSLSARRAWIEISYKVLLAMPNASLSARRAWIEIPSGFTSLSWRGESLSARRAWIEIQLVASVSNYHEVALRKESVDRNSCWLLA